jgi:hypothetical protein
MVRLGRLVAVATEGRGREPSMAVTGEIRKEGREKITKNHHILGNGFKKPPLFE